MGYVKEIKRLLECGSLEEKCKSGGDQSYLMEYYISKRKKERIELDKKSKIFQNMHLISWGDLELNEGRVYNKILKTNPSILHFNGGSWKTKDKKDIMPILIELIIKSKGEKERYNLDKYEQRITETCYPHPQK